MRLYPNVVVKGQTFANSKIHTIPMQSMSLKEILRRFVRREALPVSKEGIYEDRYDYDLEKLSKEDMTVQSEVHQEMKLRASQLDVEIKKQESDKKDAMAKATAAQRKKLFEELKAEQTTSLNPQTVKE